MSVLIAFVTALVTTMILNFWPFASPLGATIAIGAASIRAEDCAITSADSTAKRTRGSLQREPTATLRSPAARKPLPLGPRGQSRSAREMRPGDSAI